MDFFHLYLVSDSTGETVSSVCRAVLAQFDNIDAEEHNWPLLRTTSQIDKLLDEIRRNPGFVMYTVSDGNLRKHLKEGCRKIGIPCVSVISRTITDLSVFLGIKASKIKANERQELDSDYFSRVEAINFALTHDDGQSIWDLESADIVLVGVSRTSKSPTSVYLAYRGYRAANVPYVPGITVQEDIEKLKAPLVVGLTISPEVLAQIRRNRMISINEDSVTNYTDIEEIKEELLEAKKFFVRNGWPVIDVTRRSVEETAATVIKYLQTRRKKND